MINQKVRNATSITIDDIKFKSKIESNSYVKLKESGLNFRYENNKMLLQPEFKPINVTFLYPNKKQKDELVKYEGKIRPVTYTNDFTIDLDPVYIYLEVKGRPNDIYPLKRKMALFFLNNCFDGKIHIFAEVHNLKQLDYLINYIKTEYGK